jgi:hypothetical protein
VRGLAPDSCTPFVASSHLTKAGYRFRLRVGSGEISIQSCALGITAENGSTLYTKSFALYDCSGATPLQEYCSNVTQKISFTDVPKCRINGLAYSTSARLETNIGSVHAS